MICIYVYVCDKSFIHRDTLIHLHTYTYISYINTNILKAYIYHVVLQLYKLYIKF